MDELTRRLRAARHDTVPDRDLWPGVASGIGRQSRLRWQQALAALLIFGAGAFVGGLVERSGTGRAATSMTAEAPAAASPLYAAAAVQRAGSDYLAAVARLRGLGAGDEMLRLQGYEAALGVLSVTAQEVTTALDLDDREALVNRTRSARAAASQRVAVLMQRGGE